MKTTFLLVLVMLLCIINVYGQKLSVDLTFTAVNNAAYVRLDSIKVMNRTHEGETIRHWPDTTLTLDITPGDTLLYIGYSTGYPVGVGEINQENKQFHLFQNYPNPVNNQSEISMFLPGNGTVNLMITDVQGRLLITDNKYLDAGAHSFRFVPGGDNFYFLRVRWNGISQSIKILATGSTLGKGCMLDYFGSGNGESPLKTASLKKSLVMQESGILDSPYTNETYTFQFATNIPCPGTPTITYEGQVYNTIQIRSQCWLKENLNVGTMITNGNQSNNGIIEKFCYAHQQDNCTIYGGLYQWDEMMQYTNTQGSQGICPSGWHIPTDEQWKVLEGAVDSQYGIGDQTWDASYFRGIDAGTNLKTTSGWNLNGNGTDLFGFSGLPGGCRSEPNYFENMGSSGYWRTSTEYSDILEWSRRLYFDYLEMFRGHYQKELGFSVRCVRDY
jgi:uncharacterized protein (TIGR02145 family)